MQNKQFDAVKPGAQDKIEDDRKILSDTVKKGTGEALGIPRLAVQGKSVPSHEEIVTRAAALWREKGCPQACDDEIWLEAERQLWHLRCLQPDERNENGLADSSLSRNRADMKAKLGERPNSPFFRSPEMAEREIAKLHQVRERLESELTADETDVRASLI
jgi:hypothetical protein